MYVIGYLGFFAIVENLQRTVILTAVPVNIIYYLTVMIVNFAKAYIVINLDLVT